MRYKERTPGADQEHRTRASTWKNREQNTHQNESPTRDQDRGAQIGIITTRITALLMFRIHCRMLHSPCLHESITLFQSFPLLYKWKWNWKTTVFPRLLTHNSWNNSQFSYNYKPNFKTTYQLYKPHTSRSNSKIVFKNVCSFVRIELWP